MSNFYCQQKCGEEEFSIDEWNKAFKEINSMPISQSEKDKLIDGEPCKEQCLSCIALVGARRLKTSIIRMDKETGKKALTRLE